MSFFLAGFVSAQTGLRTLRNSNFETVGLDLRSANFVNELSLIVVEISERYLDPAGLAYPMPILVNLRPEEHFEFEGDYRLSLGARGSVQLDLRWVDSLSLERTCYLLTEALLIQYAIYNYGPGSEAEVPLWTISALSSEIYFRLRPSVFVDRVVLAQGMSLPSPTEIVEAHPEAPKGATYGFWLLQALKAGVADRATVRGLFQRSMTGSDIIESLTSVVQSQVTTGELIMLDAWWASQMELFLDREYEMVESMETTKGWLQALAEFNQPFGLEEGEKLNLRSLWTHRQSPEVRELVEARYEILKFRLVRANPAYYNVAQSLGSLYEKLLQEDSAHRYVFALTIYLSDWEDAKRMQEKVESALSEGT
ncbi:hypothetical protein N9Q19_00155 [Puniceicoccaceae bacterium]|nr:hypothetical protein [Puniceicoccaceae bacterium]